MLKNTVLLYFLTSVGVQASTEPKIFREETDVSYFQKSDGSRIKMPVCYDREGLKVRFSIRDDISAMAYSEYRPISGSSTRFRSHIEDFSLAAIHFTVFHECAHHSLGHPRDGYMVYQKGQTFSTNQFYNFEFSSDCEAVRMMQEEGYSFDYINKAATDFFEAAQKTRFHPSPESRYKLAMSCYHLTNQTSLMR